MILQKFHRNRSFVQPKIMELRSTEEQIDQKWSYSVGKNINNDHGDKV